MQNKTLLLSCERKIFTDKTNQEQRPYYVFTVDVAGLKVPLAPKDATAKQILLNYFECKVPD